MAGAGLHCGKGSKALNQIFVIVRESGLGIYVDVRGIFFPSFFPLLGV